MEEQNQCPTNNFTNFMKEKDEKESDSETSE